jgi:nitronate monooxygenase
LILVCAGAGGHAGTLSPFALVSEVRQFFDRHDHPRRRDHRGRARARGPGALAPTSHTVGTRFIATREANAAEAYKKMIVDSSAGRHRVQRLLLRRARQLPARQHRRLGLDPDNLPAGDRSR